MPENCQCSSQGQGLDLRGQGHRSQAQGHKIWPRGASRPNFMALKATSLPRIHYQHLQLFSVVSRKWQRSM